MNEDKKTDFEPQGEKTVENPTETVKTQNTNQPKTITAKIKKFFSISIAVIVIIAILDVMLSDSSDTPDDNSNDSSSVENIPVTQEDIDFILNRKIFMPGMETYYRLVVQDYDKVIDVDMTFAGFLNNTYFENWKWEYFTSENNIITVVLTGITNNKYNNIPILAAFSWSNTMTSPIITYYTFGKNDDGSYNTNSANEIQEEYGYEDFSTALFACDATFCFLFSFALTDVCDGEIPEQIKPILPLPEDANPIIPDIPINPPSSELPTPPAMTEQDYYEMGMSKYLANQYLEAATYFQKSGNYSDSSTMLLECYYQYGKQALSSNHTSDGEKYLSMCRGYKDTDEILLTHYYSQALKAYTDFLNDLENYGDHSTSYENTKQKLMLCEGYSDSTTMMRVTENLYNAINNIEYLSNGGANLNVVDVDVDENNILLFKNDFSGNGENLTLNTNVIEKTFEATITNIFAPNMRNYGEIKIIEALIILFSAINNVDEISQEASNEMLWNKTDNEETFVKTIDGYSITIRVVEESWGYINCYIAVTTE